MPARGLQIALEAELPRRVAVGKGTAIFVHGRCFAPTAALSRLELQVGGERQPVMAHSMPRLDAFDAVQRDAELPPAASTAHLAAQDPLGRSYRSGFWGFARIGPHARGELDLSLIATLEDGGTVTEVLGRIAIDPPREPLHAAWPASGHPRVAIAMTTYEPPADLFARQVESIRRQTHENWICIVSDDCSSSASLEQIERVIGDDRRFVLSRPSRRLGFYRNFERALSLVPDDADFVAMADQDDFWHEDKLRTLLAEIGGARLIYSDARVVSRSGDLISDTWWNQRRNNHSNLLSVLVANSITGAASLFPRELLDDALPFPPAQFAHFHDHWVGLVALALGDVEYVERALYDYVQHGGASLGHAAANVVPPSFAQRVVGLRPTRERVRLWRLHYFVDACRLRQLATILEMRCWAGMRPAKRRSLRRYLKAETSAAALIGLGLRGALDLIGPSETLGAEWMLFHALTWRRLLALTARERPQRLFRMDALPPPTLALPPGRRDLPTAAREIAEKIAPLRWVVADDAPLRVNLLIPTVDLAHLFGGYIAKLNLARRLAERGCRVRIVTVDPTPPLPSDWRAKVHSYRGLDGLLERVELAFGRESSELEISPRDGFIASTWWTAHIANEALRYVDHERFVYLIQEYEPFTFPMGTYAALADSSYRFPHFALFSSELLREYFRRHRIGVYKGGESPGDRDSASFQNAITPVSAPNEEQLAQRSRRSLLFYARPEPHAARNMFELGVLALSAAVSDGVFSSGWRLRGIGTVGRATQLDLGGAALELIPRSHQAEYARLLAEHDLGLALMYTPHPSLVPIEMAAAGMITVTNSFENKTPEAMARISSNLVVADPSVEGVRTALHAAAANVTDVSARVRGSAVRWSADWDRSFDEELLSRLMSVLG